MVEFLWKEAVMKSLVFAVGIATIALPLTAAQSAVLTVGGGYARSCYEASEAHNPSPANIEVCNRAFAEQALDRHDEVATHVNRGILYYIADDVAAANADYDQALALDPNEAEIWLNKGMAELKARRSQSAASMFEKALALKTVRPALAYYGRAVVNEDMGNIRQAYADLRRAQALDPRWPVPAEELRRFVVR
jgi:tetratricopeptide (TPR) repeat protein